ncbi:hypothetical protein QJQ45_004463 [Haematococcus lacustris]|nr:hypothetical protein QJQ45_004463 [Haematococcus lacustris]
MSRSLWRCRCRLLSCRWVQEETLSGLRKGIGLQAGAWSTGRQVQRIAAGLAVSGSAMAARQHCHHGAQGVALQLYVATTSNGLEIKSRTASGSGQQDQEQGQGQAVKEVIGERRQVIKAALRGLVEAARPDLSPAEVDAVVAEVSKRMTMGSKQCGLAAVLCLAVLLQSSLAPAQLPPPVQLNIWDPQLLVQIRDAMELLTKASVLEHLMRGPHHRGMRLLPGEVAVFEQPNSTWPVAMLKQLDEEHLRGNLSDAPRPAA